MSRIFYEFSINYFFATNSILRFMSIAAARRLRVLRELDKERCKALKQTSHLLEWFALNRLMYRLLDLALQ